MNGLAAAGAIKDESNPLDFHIRDCELPSVPHMTLRNFTITTDSYISLCSRVYAATCSENSDFADKISESAFQYYAVLVLWKRFAVILPDSVKEGSKFFKDISRIIMPPLIPTPLLTYLSGIGHFHDPDGPERRFVMPVFPTDQRIGGVSNTFGKVNAKTHYYYEAFPAPGIALLRMLADYKYTNDKCQKNLIWELPEGLRPDIVESHVESSMPTKNLLGWAPAQALTENQLQSLEAMEKESMSNSLSTLSPGLNQLFNKIHTHLKKSPSPSLTVIFEAARERLFSPIGSLVQGVTTEKHDQFVKFDRSAMYCEGSVSVTSSYRLKDELNTAAVISGYRMSKEPIDNRHCWACYDFDEYKSVPESWIRSRNMIYTYGSVGRLNESVYSTGRVTKQVLQNKCIQSTMFETKTKWNIYK